MNRRNFLQGLITASAGFAILPGAGRLWLPTMPVVYVREHIYTHPWLNEQWLAGKAWLDSADMKTLNWECPVEEQAQMRTAVQLSADNNFGPSIVRYVKHLPGWLVARRQRYRDRMDEEWAKVTGQNTLLNTQVINTTL